MIKKFLDWTKTDGIKVLRDIGVKEKDIIIDFGCGDGFYCLSAGYIVGKKGKVYAIDRNISGIRNLERSYYNSGLKNIEIIKTNGELDLDLEDEIADVALLYDVLHYFDYSSRKKLLIEMHRILKKEAILSIHPTHHSDHNTITNLINELADIGFDYKSKEKESLIHYDFFEESFVYNFKKL